MDMWQNMQQQYWKYKKCQNMTSNSMLQQDQNCWLFFNFKMNAPLRGITLDKLDSSQINKIARISVRDCTMTMKQA